MLEEAKTTVPKLSLSNVSSGYGPVAIIEALSLAIAPGQIFALMGKNGMGKTTVLKTILGFGRCVRATSASTVCRCQAFPRPR